MAWTGGAPEFRDTVFSDNDALESGGALHIQQSSVSLYDCSLQGNSAVHAGGGVSLDSSDAVLNQCVVRDNAAGASGGGVFINSASSAALANTTVCFNIEDQIAGVWSDEGGNSVDCPECDADFTGPEGMADSVVGTDDLLGLISAWGSSDSDADVDGNGVVSTNDLLLLIAAWGPCE